MVAVDAEQIIMLREVLSATGWLDRTREFGRALRVTSMRKVPSSIPRPEYVGKKRPKTGEPDVKSPEIIERMRVAGRIAAQALDEVGKHIRPGVTTDELD